MGESRGRWEGDTLVVETINFKGPTSFGGSSEKMKLTERFTLDGANTLLYRFTVEDPTTWVKPWTAEIPMARSAEPIYEYACHEGNHRDGRDSQGRPHGRKASRETDNRVAVSGRVIAWQRRHHGLIAVPCSS